VGSNPTLTAIYPPGIAKSVRPRHYHADRQGNVLAVTRAGADALVQQFFYTPFGVELVGDASGNPFRYTGRRHDPETGLYYYRARYYDPDLGRFLQVDPIGYEDQWNLYAYVGNNPLNATDPTGEACYPVNNWSQYCRNARLYRNYDRHRGIRSQTNFFRAAELVSDSFGSAWILGSNFVLDRSTRQHLSNINWMLRGKNTDAAQQMAGGTWRGHGSIEANDNAMVHFEQSAVQDYLDGMDAGVRDAFVSDMNDFLNTDHPGVRFGRALDPMVSDSIRAVREELGGDIDFANQEHREMIGREVVSRVREERTCTTGSRICR
jgi:RHS repeat-associated protein